MTLRQGQVTDEYDRPIADASVYVTDLTVGSSTIGQQATITSDGVTPLTQPVTTDEFGVYTYHAAPGLYREDTWFGSKLRYKEVVPLDYAWTKGDPGSPGEGYGARGLIAALAATPFDDVFLTELGREGKFVFSNANHAAHVSADPNQGVYIAPASDVTGASGAWIRQFESTLRPEWFGAKGDGVFNDQPAIQATINLLVALGGGTVKFRAATYVCNTALSWNAAPIELRGSGATVQPNGGTTLKFPVGLNGAVNFKNGPAALGAGSAIRHLRVKGSGAVAVSDADALTGKGAGLLIQSNSFIVENVVAQGFEGNGAMVLSGYPGADPALNANNGVIEGLHCWDNLKNGFATYGVDSNNARIGLIDCSNNGQFGLYENSFLGSVYDNLHASGNTTGAIRVGSLSRSNRITFYKEIGTALTILIDAGGGGRNHFDLRQVEGDGGGTVTITDNSATGDNTWDYNSVLNRGRFGLSKTDGAVLIGDNGVNIYKAYPLQLFDAAAATVWQLANAAGNAIISAGHIGSFYVDVGGNHIHFTDANGLNLAAGKVLKVGGVQVVGPQQGGIAHSASGSADQAYINAIIDVLRAHGLIGP